MERPSSPVMEPCPVPVADPCGDLRTLDARDLLAQVYDRFTEGFDTVDLKEAKALLDEPT